MNRVRAWDGTRMILPEGHCYYQHYVSFCGSIVQRSSEGMSCFGGGDRWRVVDNLTVMLSTGIFDKDGIEIYEGDIVEQWVNNHYWRYVIQKLEGFGNNLWACCYEDNYSVDEENNRYTFQKQKVELGSVRSYVNKQMKVIGNIYQNRGLLGENI